LGYCSRRVVKGKYRSKFGFIRYKWGSTVGSYPDYEKLIPTEFVAEARFDTRDMLRASPS